jgi:hypothetical protein
MGAHPEHHAGAVARQELLIDKNRVKKSSMSSNYLNVEPRIVMANSTSLHTGPSRPSMRHCCLAISRCVAQTRFEGQGMNCIIR